MHLVVPELIPPALAAALRTALGRAKFVDGLGSVIPPDRSMKHNLELPDTRQLPRELLDGIAQGLTANQQLMAWAMPRLCAPLRFNRFDTGMYYRDHVDDALGVVDREFHRADVSVTIFLSEPADYDGGELVVSSDVDPRPFKLPAGYALAYTSGTLHRVNEVTRGSRLAVVTWIESLIRDHEQRQILADLVRVRDGAGTLPAAELRQLVSKACVSLTRKWS
jgi:PKHD-type hydroxylase